MSEDGATAERALRALARPGAWLDAVGEGRYAVRLADDRRRRPFLQIDETVFIALTREPGLRRREQSGWRLARVPQWPASPPAGRPSVLEGRRRIVDPQGVGGVRTVNLGESPIAWLARRRDARGEAWLSPPEIAAAEKLREDFVIAGTVGRLTMAWDAGPRTRGGRGPGLDPAEKARAAKGRIASALTAVGPGLRDILEYVCFAGTALDAAERSLGLPRRSGKTVLKLALGRLAGHYGLG